MGSPLVMTVTRPRKYLTSPKQVFNEVFLSSFVPLMAFMLSHSDRMLGLRWLLCVHKFSCHVSNDKTTLMMIFVLSVVLSVFLLLVVHAN